MPISETRSQKPETRNPAPSPWFDAHLDLPYLALHGRDMLAPADQATGGDLPASLTFHSMRMGNIRYALGTLFINPGMPDAPFGYSDSSDIQRAHDRAVTQLHLYQQWEREGILQIVRSKADLQNNPDSPLKLLILMEGADGIRTPDEAQWWFDQGLRVTSLTWARGSRYAAGDATTSTDQGLSDLGIALVKAFDSLGIIHDLSHLSDQSAAQLLNISSKPVIASHSACRALQGDPKRMRHITDDLAREIAHRGGVIGLPLYTRFLSPPGDVSRASIPRTCDHLDHLASVTGSRIHVALGSDLDGGFSANDLPLGIQSPSEYPKLTAELASRNWSPTDLANFQQNNWLRFFASNLQ